MTINHILTHSRRPDITIRVGGRIDIAARIARILALRPGDVIDLSLDSYGTLALYVKIKAAQRIGRHIGTVFPAARSRDIPRGTFRCSSIALASAIAQASQHTPTLRAPLRLPCGEHSTADDGTILIPIITRNPL